MKLPMTEDFYGRIISIPMYYALTDEVLGYVLDSFDEVLGNL